MPFTFNVYFGDLWPHQLTESAIQHSPHLSIDIKHRIVNLRKSYLKTFNDNIHLENYNSIDTLEEYFDNMQSLIEQFFVRDIRNRSVAIEMTLTVNPQQRGGPDMPTAEAARRSLVGLLLAARTGFSREISHRVDGVFAVAREERERLRPRSE